MKKLITIAIVGLVLSGCNDAVGPPAVSTPAVTTPNTTPDPVRTPEEQAALEETAKGAAGNNQP